MNPVEIPQPAPDLGPSNISDSPSDLAGVSPDTIEQLELSGLPVAASAPGETSDVPPSAPRESIESIDAGEGGDVGAEDDDAEDPDLGFVDRAREGDVPPESTPGTDTGSDNDAG